MGTLIGILVAIILIGVVVWGISKILNLPQVGIPEPFKTIIWVIVVIIAVFAFVEISGLYHFSFLK
jgi:CDP-diglyceride synthetase